MSWIDFDNSIPDLVPFDEIWADFGVNEKPENLVQVEEDHGYASFIRFALIRSMDTPHLQSLLSSENTGIRELMEEAYDSNLSIDALTEFIRERWVEETENREREYQRIAHILELFGSDLTTSTKISGPAGVRGYIQAKLRHMKNLESDAGLSSEFEAMQNEITNYANWQMFSLLTNDLVELFHGQTLPDNMIPTLRRIREIDFFVKIDGRIHPFDLKTSYIPTKYYEPEGGWYFASTEDDDFVSFESLRGDQAALDELVGLYRLEVDVATHANVKKALQDCGIGAETQLGGKLVKSITEPQKRELKELCETRKELIKQRYQQYASLCKEKVSRLKQELLIINKQQSIGHLNLAENIEREIGEWTLPSWSALQNHPVEGSTRVQSQIGRALAILEEHDDLPTELPDIERQIDTICAQIQTTENDISEASLDKAADYVEFFERDYPELKDLMMESRKNALQGLKENPHKLEHLFFRDQDTPRFGNNNRMFIILGFEDHIGNENDAALMKLHTQNLSEELIRFISNLSLEDVREIRYTHKEKGPFTGAHAASVIITQPFRESS